MNGLTTYQKEINNLKERMNKMEQNLSASTLKISFERADEFDVIENFEINITDEATVPDMANAFGRVLALMGYSPKSITEYIHCEILEY